MFARRAEMVSAASRCPMTGEAGVDYKVDGNRDCILLYTADKEGIKKGTRYKVTLTTAVKPRKRLIVVKPNPALLEMAVVTGPVWLDPEDDGVISLNITPREDIVFADLEYICKLYLESTLR